MKLWKKIRQIARRRQFEKDLAEELSFHREMAGPAFGSVALALEDSRAVWSFGWLDSLSQDLRYALRGFRKTPGFALTIIGTIGLALGLNTTLFTVFNAYVLRPMAVSDPYSLYGATWVNQKGQRHSWTTAEFEQLRANGAGFGEVAAFDGLLAALDGHTMFGQSVSGNYFTMLGEGTFLGRPLLPGDSDSLVLSYSAWQDWYGGSPDVIGKKSYLRGRPFEIVGISSPGFGGLMSFPAQFFVPMDGPWPLETVHPGGANVVGRLRRGMSLEATRAALLVWARQMSAGLPEQQRAANVLLESNATMIPLSREALGVFMPVFVAFALVLVIACVNVSNMMLARALARQREIGIRVSLGAGRARLIRQLLTESLLLALPAALAGFIISKLTMEFSTRLMYATLPPEFGRLIRLVDLSPDARVFGFILLASLAATLVFGLVPAIQTTRGRLVEANRGDFSTDYRPTRLRNALVVVQVTVCALLLICAGIVLRGELRVSGADLGVDTRGVFDVRLMEKYQAKSVSVLASDPGVEAVAVAWLAPVSGSLRRMAVMPSGRRETVISAYNFVSPEYFSIFRIPLLQGRNFSADEAQAESPVVVVSETAARRLFPKGDAVGQSFAILTEGSKDPYFGRVPHHRTALVIGVARDVVNGWDDTSRETDCLYFPTNPQAAGNGALLVRLHAHSTAGGALDLSRALDRVEPSIADMINSMEGVVAVESYPYRVGFWISAFLGGLALALTVSGIYGVLSYLVSQRSREIGIRVALGAGAGDVVGMVMKQSTRLAAIGTGLGLLFALAVAPVFAHHVSALNPFDVTAYGGSVVLVMAAAVGAAFNPSRRAAAIDPATTLRSD